MLEDKEMRVTYCNELIKLAENDDRIVLLEADLMRATGTLAFKEKFPSRVIDVGVAEANMMGVAAGLSAYGKIPFAHSFAPFATRRCFDQITISIAYAGLNVKIGGTDPSVSAELNGGTHMSMEDVGIMRTIPNMVIFEPADSTQLKRSLPQIIEHYGPVYTRLYRKVAEKIYDDSYEFKLGRADTLVEGKDAVIFASGLMVKNSLDAAEVLKKEGISVKVINVHTIKPIDKEAIVKAASETGAAVTAENHSMIGGLGSAVAEVLIENCPVPMKRVGVMDRFGQVGKKDFLMQEYNLTAGDIASAVKDVVKRK